MQDKGKEILVKTKYVISNLVKWTGRRIAKYNLDL